MVGQLEKEKKNKEPRGNPDGKTIVNISKKKKGNKQTKNEKKKKKKNWEKSKAGRLETRSGKDLCLQF